jgi:hypothetical protein
MRRSYAVLAALAFSLAPASSFGASCEQDQFKHKVWPLAVASGAQSNSLGVEQVVFSTQVQVLDAPWVRAIFDDVQLAPGSYIRVTSLTDGESQALDSKGLGEWQNTTAYFNGPAIAVELVAAPSSVGNSLSMSMVMAGDVPDSGVGTEQVCVAVDDRVLSDDERTARLLAVTLPVAGCPSGLPCDDLQALGCTGFIINYAPEDDPNDRCMLSAGHCVNTSAGTMTVVQFEDVPLSVGCSIRHPPVAKQFVIDPATIPGHFLNAGVGDDWSVFLTFDNPASGNTVFEEQGVQFALAAATPAKGTAISKFGYGTQGEPPPAGDWCTCNAADALSIFHKVQQTDSALIRERAGTHLCHDIHTCPADSGSPVFPSSESVVAIHTHGTCGAAIGPCAAGLALPRNAGTQTTHPGLRLAIADLCPKKAEIPAFDTRGLIALGGLLLLTMAGEDYYRRRRAM